MSKSKQLVYMPSLRKDTWLLMSKRLNTVHIREYSESGVEIIEKMNLEKAENLLAQPNAYVERDASFNRVSVDSIDFWNEQIRFRNIELNDAKTKKEHRLQDEFKKQCKPFIEQEQVQELRGIFRVWRDKFTQINDKEQFNHWDNDDASKHCRLDTGMGWTSYLLEHSRKDGAIGWIPTGNSLTDFSMASMELNLGISSKVNEFSPGNTDYIKPDGLGIRPNGFMTVIEVKGPKDESSLLDPMLQAVCGALAVVAKKKMLCEVARTAGDRRPAYTNAKIPKTRPSLGVHVLTAKYNDRGVERLEPWCPKIEAACHTVLAAFHELEYIAYSFVVPDSKDPFAELSIDHLITKGIG